MLAINRVKILSTGGFSACVHCVQVITQANTNKQNHKVKLKAICSIKVKAHS